MKEKNKSKLHKELILNPQLLFRKGVGYGTNRKL